jgi:alpha-tubulin suppressor-like RCC1 family protein
MTFSSFENEIYRKLTFSFSWMTDDGNLWGFGQNNSFQIGYSPQLLPQSTPRLISAFQGMKVDAVACGSTHTLVSTTTPDGVTQVWGMGSDNCGQLGLGSGSNTNAPTLVPALCNLPVASMICGAYFSMVRTTDGQVYAFGQNSHGELGLGHTVYVIKSILFFFVFFSTDFACFLGIQWCQPCYHSMWILWMLHVDTIMRYF